MSDIEPTPQVHWRVIGQLETTGPLPTGSFGAGRRVTFELDNGTVASVFIPEAAYTNVDQVRAQIAQAAARVATVGKLTSEG